MINKIDVLERAEDREQVRRFVAEHAQALLGSQPEVFPCRRGTRCAQKLGDAGGEPVAGDRFADLERYIARRSTRESACG